MTDFVWRDGQRLTPYMAWQISRLDADLHSLFGVHVLITSAIRLYEDQKRIFLERYVTAGNVRGRRVYDTRWWAGQLWYRISSLGTVAQPGTSNHEIQGNRAAVDLRDTGSDAGIATGGSRRSNWLRANAWRYDLVPSGFGFGEAWHYDVQNIYNSVPGAPAAAPPLEGGNMESVKVGKHIFGFADFGGITHFGTEAQEKITRQVSSPRDEQHGISSGEFLELLDGKGIPRWVVDIAGGRVVNPENTTDGVNGTLERNGTWSWARFNFAETRRLTAAVAALNTQVAALAKAAPKSS